MKTKNNKLKRAVVVIAFVLLIVLAAGFSMQLFMPAGKKVSDWVEKIKNQFSAKQPLIEVGDEITILYGNTSKTREEVIAMLDSLDWTDAKSFYGGSYVELKLCTFEAVTGSDGKLYYPYLHAQKTSSEKYYISCSLGEPVNGHTGEVLWYSDSGWKLTPNFNGSTFIVEAVYQQDLWQDFISKVPFANS